MNKSLLLFLWVLGLAVQPVFAFDSGSSNTKSEQFDTLAERIGGLRLGLSEKDAAKSIPSCKLWKGKEIFEGATGEYVQVWKSAKCGIELKMGSERKGGAKTVESITLTSPGSLVTSRGIRIGSTEDEVFKAYGRYQDRDEGNIEKGKELVAGSIYDGMIFELKNGKVVRIFLGAAAE